uniref:Uncharacterized protein n=1 Tax=Triticum urartu TaxID=4572 RepID=A0A8R7TLH2_TRIUA
MCEATGTVGTFCCSDDDQYSHRSGSSRRNTPAPTMSSSTTQDDAHGRPAEASYLRSRSRSGRSNRASSGSWTGSACGAGGGGGETALASEALSGLLALALAPQGKSAEAASMAAAWTSLGAALAGRGSRCARSGKLRCAARLLMASVATSCARAAISAVAKVPSQMRDFLRGSLISDTHLPQLRMRTPW